MFAGIACKIGFGMMLALLSQLGGAIAAKTPAERLHDMLALIARSELNAVQRTCHAVEMTVVDEIKQAGAARALGNAAEAVARRVERVVETWQRRVERVVEFVTVKLPARVEAAWNEFKAAVTGDERARGDEFQAEI
jgi:predicted TIM-barrel fold metal-dependent hydrolase